MKSILFTLCLFGAVVTQASDSFKSDSVDQVSCVSTSFFQQIKVLVNEIVTNSNMASASANPGDQAAYAVASESAATQKTSLDSVYRDYLDNKVSGEAIAPECYKQ